jgi:GNAT superfamily N-acetyltransferase
MQDRVTIKQATEAEQISQARELFREYAASLDFELCFQSFDQELAGLPGKYAPPHGRLLLAECVGRLAGCVALRRLDDEICEMKRLFVRPDFRGKGLGHLLAERVLEEARGIGYRRMRLDTVARSMGKAVAMYRELGFVEIAPYCVNPIEGALYFERQL